MVYVHVCIVYVWFVYVHVCTVYVWFVYVHVCRVYVWFVYVHVCRVYVWCMCCVSSYMGNLFFLYQVNPQQSSYFSESISRGVTPNNAYPFSYRPHYAQYVDPDTGNISKIIVVPSAMVSVHATVATDQKLLCACHISQAHTHTHLKIGLQTS